MDNRSIVPHETPQFRRQEEGHTESMELCLNLCDNLPNETISLLKKSHLVLRMGGPIVAQALMLQCVKYMDEAKESLAQSASVAGSVVDFEAPTNQSRVQRWLGPNTSAVRSNRSEANYSFMNDTNRTGKSFAVNRTLMRSVVDGSGFKKPQLPMNHPRNRPMAHQAQNRLAPINEARAMAAPPPQQRRPLAQYQEFVPSDTGAPVQRVKKLVRSTPIRPSGSSTKRKNYEGDENMEALFSDMSPLSVQNKTNQLKPKPMPPCATASATNSDSSASANSIVTVKRRVVKSKKQLSPELEDEDELNTTVTRRGRYSKPKLHSFEGKDLSEQCEKANSTNQPSTSGISQPRTAVKKRKLTSDINDETEGSSKSLAQNSTMKGGAPRGRPRLNLSSTASSKSCSSKKPKNQDTVLKTKPRTKGPPPISFDNNGTLSYSDDSD